MRVVIRFSLNGDSGSTLRNALKTILEDKGINWTGRTTATYEGDVAESAIREALSSFWKRVANFRPPTKLDHFWMYTDRRPPPIMDAPE